MNSIHETLARRLREAYERGPVAPLRDGLMPTDAEGAYAVQAINTQFWLGNGRRQVGRKIGLTAKSVQQQLGVDQPDYGVLFHDMSVPDDGELSISKVLQPKVEGEVAVIMGSELTDPNVSMTNVLDAVAFIAPAIEIVGSRISDWQISFADTVADNGSSGSFVLGPKHPFRSELDLYSCGMVLEVNSEIRSVGAGAACLGHPLKALYWLCKFLAEKGEGVSEGEVILTGALGPMISLESGSKVKVTIGGIGTASFTCTE